MPGLITYFKKFPVVDYDMSGTGLEVKKVVNILARVKLREKVRNNAYIYYDYSIQDGERPEHIAHKYYGNSNYHWLVFFSNSLIDPYFDWPMQYNDFIAFIEKKYGSIPHAHQVIHHYETSSGVIIDEDTYNATPAVDRRAVSNYDYEFELNESKRNIKLIDKKYLGTIDAELNELLEE